MAEHVCPWWIGYLLAGPWRKFWHDPARILEPYVREGMTVLEPGPGMGFFTLEMARRVGASGRVVAVDIQPRMLESLKRRAQKAGLLDRVDARLVQPDSMGLEDLAGKVDFVLAFAVVHELPSTGQFFQQAALSLTPVGSLLLAEPPGHVSVAKFDEELAAAASAGLQVADRPVLRRSHAALLRKAG